MKPAEPRGEERLVRVAAGQVTLEGNLSLPEGSRGIVLFAHGSGSSRHSPRNRYVARVLNEAKLATLLVDLLTPDEEAVDLRAAHLRFDIGLLAARLVGATDWLTQYPDTRALRIGYFGASTGAAAALVAAAQRPDAVGAGQPLHVEPKGEVSRMYGAYREGDETSERALFMLDQEAVIHWSYISPVGVNPGADGILRARRTTGKAGSVMTISEWEAVLALPVEPARDHIRGPRDAPVSLVEYGDYECPYCGAAYPIVEEIIARMGETLQFVYRHFPMTTVHPHAEQAAEAAEAAGAQRRFWEMHSILFGNQQHLDTPYLHAYAEALGLDVHRFDREIADHVHADRVREDFLSGVRSGVAGTPTFYINGVRHDDSYDLPVLLTALQRAASLGA